MSYVVISRKWRPLVFDDVIAQDHITATLKNAISSGRIAHAYLFAGPRGVGKTTTARILAKALNCVQGPTPTPCNKCTLCKEITNGVSLDVLEIDGASNRGIDEVRDLRDNVRYAPSQGRYKIYYIDEVHMLTIPAFNALLKTLEEPPSHVIFIFATTQPQNIPLTILSRCQRFDFKRIPTSEIIKRLRFIAAQEGVEINEDSLLLIAKKADGAMRDAESLLDQVISFGGEKISQEVVEDLLGLIDREVFFELVAAVLSKDTKRGLELVGEVIDTGCDIGEFTGGLLEHLRNLLFAKIPGGARSIEASETDKARYQEQSGHFSEEDLLRMIRIISDLESSVNRAPHPRLRLEIAVVRLIKLDSTVLLTELLERFSQLEQRVTGGYGQAPKDLWSLSGQASIFEVPAKAGEVDEKPVTYLSDRKEEVKTRVKDHPERSEAESKGTLESVQESWQRIIAEVKERKRSLGSILADGVPTDVSKGVLRIVFEKEKAFSAKQVEKNRKVVEEVLSGIFDSHVRVKCVVESAKVPEEEKAKGPSSLESLCREEPILRKVVEIFDGELVEV